MSLWHECECKIGEEKEFDALVHFRLGHKNYNFKTRVKGTPFELVPGFYFFATKDYHPNGDWCVFEETMGIELFSTEKDRDLEDVISDTVRGLINSNIENFTHEINNKTFNVGELDEISNESAKNLY